MSFGKTAAITIFINHKYNVTQLTVCPRITLNRKQKGNYTYEIFENDIFRLIVLIQQKLSLFLPS